MLSFEILKIKSYSGIPKKIYWRQNLNRFSNFLPIKNKFLKLFVQKFSFEY